MANGARATGTEQDRIEQHDERRVVGGEVARQQHEEGVGEHAAEGVGERRMQAADAGMHDDEYADEADEDGDEAPPADPLAEEWSGEQGHDERGEEGHRDGLIEAQVAQRQEVAGGGRHHEEGAQQLELELAGAQQR